MPEPLEKERKFLVRNFRRELIPADAAAIEIEQIYLQSPAQAGHRVRKRIANGIARYFYTEKQDTGEPGVRVEREAEITPAQYQHYLAQRDPQAQPIRKTRYVFPYAGRCFELDVFQEPARGLVLLEVELDDMSEPIALPPDWDLEEVTGDPRYDNAQIARSPPIGWRGIAS